MGDAPQPLWTALGASRPVHALALGGTPNRPLSAAAVGDGMIWVWDPVTGDFLRTLMAGHGPVRAVAVTDSDSGALVIGAGDDGMIRAWNLDRDDAFGGDSPVLEWTRSAEAVLSLAVGSVGGRLFVFSGGADGMVLGHRLDPEGHPATGPHTEFRFGEGAGPVESLAVHEHARGAFVGYASWGGARIWDLRSGFEPSLEFDGHTDPVRSLDLVEVRGAVLAVSVGYDGLIYVLGAVSGERLQTIRPPAGDQYLTAAGLRVGDEVMIVATTETGRVVTMNPSAADSTQERWTGQRADVLTTAELAGRALLLTGGEAGLGPLTDLSSGEFLFGPPGGAAPIRLLVAGTIGERAVLAGVCDPGTVRIWDQVTGEVLLEFGEPGGVTSLALGERAERAVLVIVAAGVVQVRDGVTGALDLELANPSGPVRSVVLLGGDGERRVAGVTADGSFQTWDLELGTPLNSLAQIPGLGPVALDRDDDGDWIAVRAADGGYRRWNPATGRRSDSSFAEGRVRTLTSLPDGGIEVLVDLDRPDELLLDRRGSQVPDGRATNHLRGRTSGVSLMVTGQWAGREVAVGAAGPEIRVWDLTRGLLIGSFAPDGFSVTSLVRGSDGRLFTAGEGGRVQSWDVAALLRETPRGLEEVFGGEDTGSEDRIGRFGLATHVADWTLRLVGGERGPQGSGRSVPPDLGRSAILHLDGRWGAGKTTLLEQLLRPSTGGGRETGGLHGAVVVRYDAWRQAAVAPEWWSVASEVRRAIHGERSLPARVVLTGFGYLRRLGRSTSTWVGLGAVTVLAALSAALVVADKGGAVGRISGGLGLLTTLTGALALVFVVTRGLFWTSPVLGRLHLKTDDNPLAEISSVVGHLRRWSPRQGVPHRAAEWLTSVVVAVAIGPALLGDRLMSWWRPIRDGEAGRFVRDQLLAAEVLVPAVAALLLALSWWRFQRLLGEPGMTWRRAGRRALRSPGNRYAEYQWKRLRRRSDRRFTETSASSGGERARGRRSATTMVGILVVLLVVVAGRRAWPEMGERPVLLGAAAAVAAVVAFALFERWSLGRARRLVLLVIDDLDRCEGDRVVRLLETVHTMLRERAAPRWWRRWREPAPFAVLVLANGAWIRDAFTAHYTEFERDGDDVHDLGADFLQKIFDHSVLVPALSTEQTEDLTHVVTRSSFRVTPERGPRRIGASRGAGLLEALPTRQVDLAAPGAAPQPRAGGGTGTAELSPDDLAADPAPASTSAPDPVSEPAETLGAHFPAPAAPAPRASGAPEGGSTPSNHGVDLEMEAVAAARADMGEEGVLLVTHLLTRYPAILPRNPRMIIRVASAWAMLRAVGRSLNLEVEAEPEAEHVVRAAVIWVRFPVLVDRLIDADEPPVVDPTNEECTGIWRRRDVQQVLTLRNGERMDPVDLAVFYGKEFAPAVPAPVTPAAG